MHFDDEKIILSSFSEVDEIDSALIKKNIDSFFEKVQQVSKEKPILKMHLKDYNKDGLRKEHEIKSQLELNKVTLYASAKGWQLISVIQESLQKLEKELKKEFRKK